MTSRAAWLGWGWGGGDRFLHVLMGGHHIFFFFVKKPVFTWRNAMQSRFLC